MITKSKILFAGLDNCGKTSIIKSIQQKFPFTSSRPTIGLERKGITRVPCLGMEFIAWDLAGQRRFRENYFERAKMVFLNTTTLFYIIDIQEENRYYESLQYLYDILNVYNQNNGFPKIIICIHKTDPSLLNDIEKFSTLKRKIIPGLAKCLENVNYYLCFTSIYEIPTLLRALTRGIIEDQPKSIMIQSILKKYIQMTFSESAVIFSKDLLIIGEFSNSERNLQVCYSITPRFAIAMEKIEEYHMDSKKIIMDIEIYSHKLPNKDSLKKALFFLIPLKISKHDIFYLSTLTNNPRSINFCLKYIPKLQKQLEDLLFMITTPVVEMIN